MAVPSLGAWFALRAASGIASGFAFVAVSSLVLDRAAADGRHSWAPWLYAGVGGGIALTGLLTPPFVALGGWQGGWIGLGAVALAGAAFAAVAVTRGGVAAPATARTPFSAPRMLFPWLLTAYAAQGFGYIVPATFLVAPSRRPVAGLRRLADVDRRRARRHSVDALLEPRPLRYGAMKTLIWAQLFQAPGTVMPVVEPNALGVAFAAVALGGTFMGITSLANSTARAMFPGELMARSASDRRLRRRPDPRPAGDELRRHADPCVSAGPRSPAPPSSSAARRCWSAPTSRSAPTANRQRRLRALVFRAVGEISVGCSSSR